MVFVIGCNDSAVTEIEVQDEEQVELILPSDDPEPPELVAEYYALWDEIEREKLDGKLDSTKVLKAHRLAVELSKYDGPMAKVFEIFQGHAEGKSTQELKEIAVKNCRLAHAASDGFSPCVMRCRNKHLQEYSDAVEDASHRQDDCVAAGGIGGGVGLVTLHPPTMVITALGSAACMISNIRTLYKDLGRADRKLEKCLRDCESPI
ncbi:MAG: hypothetical protein F4100_06295 [Rhodothermaceae bacterium]|nr:hypothetical protein [Rhodothermaceae bacterium]MYE62536.1 hypothetical protein [Rhodothermaceae bacterium]MYJ20339.1 hypothetical protein [Rhodothermaceae bacterium]